MSIALIRSAKDSRGGVILSEAKDRALGSESIVSHVDNSHLQARCFTPPCFVQHDKARGRLRTLIGCLLILAGGCVSQPQRLAVCPGKATAQEALQTLAARAASAVPLRATGEILLTYHVPDRRKPERHILRGMELRFNPPTELYIQGSVAVDPRAVIVGSNDRQFWLVLRPKEMSSYYLGEWQDVRDFENLVMSPRVVLEAVGIVVEPGAEPNAALWTLENKGPYDILTRRDQAGRIVERVHIYACDYLVHKIEYFDRRGRTVAVADFSEYKPVVEGFPVPTRIQAVSTGPDGRKDSIVMDIASVKPTQFNEKQRQGLFNPPARDRFEHIYRYQDGRWVPQ
ncbi:MAG: hypothetical protein A2Y77_17450 [Planctomycetes bacterium RBG_13_62_9]|nr:MAG: hypothetical protein A2Y77_17450 [Planctomycetes bacterium RBG_13_62_9]